MVIYLVDYSRYLSLRAGLHHGPWRGICGTHLESSIQDIVDEVAPIKKKAPLWG